MSGDFASGDEAESHLNDFFLPEEGEADPRPILRRLVEDLPEFSDLKTGEAAFMVVMRAIPEQRQGRQVIGTMALPRFQGRLAPFCTWLLAKACGGIIPDFILTIEALWWATATPLAREALVYHELCHCEHAKDREGELRFTDEGLPVWGIKGHDLEEFNAVVARYGAWEPGITGFIDALRKGGAI